MLEELEALLAEARAEIAKSASEPELELLRVKYLGKKGSLSALLRGMGKLAADNGPRRARR